MPLAWLLPHLGERKFCKNQIRLEDWNSGAGPQTHPSLLAQHIVDPATKIQEC